MAIFGLNPHKVVEVGKLNGLLTGHMEAQAAYDCGEATFLDNGAILALDNDGTLIDAPTGSKEIFLHYTEELMAGPVAGYQYFTVEADADGICYPRAIALAIGDEFVTDNYATTADGIYARVVDGVLTVNSVATGAGALFAVSADTLPNGTVAKAFKLVSLDKTVA